MPRTKEQFDKMREKTHKLIMDTSLELFATQGYNGTSMSQIANKAGISKGLAYTYFKSKEDILNKLIEFAILDKFEMIEINVPAIDKITTPKEKILQIIEKSFDTIINEQNWLRLITRLFLQPGVSENTQDLINKYHERIKKLNDFYVNIFSDLGFKDPVSEMYFFAALINGIFLELSSHGKDYPIEKVKDTLIERYSSIQNKLVSTISENTYPCSRE